MTIDTFVLALNKVFMPVLFPFSAGFMSPFTRSNYIFRLP
jgi:hypothetical protein